MPVPLKDPSGASQTGQTTFWKQSNFCHPSGDMNLAASPISETTKRGRRHAIGALPKAIVMAFPDAVETVSNRRSAQGSAFIELFVTLSLFPPLLFQLFQLLFLVTQLKLFRQVSKASGTLPKASGNDTFAAMRTNEIHALYLSRRSRIVNPPASPIYNGRMIKTSFDLRSRLFLEDSKLTKFPDDLVWEQTVWPHSIEKGLNSKTTGFILSLKEVTKGPARTTT